MSDNKAEIIKRARQLTKKGYSILPVNSLKNPVVANWTQWQTRPMTDDEIEEHFVNNKAATGVALLMGGPKAITAIDFDEKYFTNPNMYEEVLSKIPVSIYKKCMVNETINFGKHWIFSHPVGVGNIKLAQRETTDEEVAETYRLNLESGSGVKKAMREALGDKVRVLIETRSFTSTVTHDKQIINKSAGYVVFPESKGYKYIEGKIGVLTKEEFELLLSVMREFNTFVPEKYNLKASATLGNDIWEEANNKLDTVEMLTAVGWKVIREVGDEVRLLRPGVVSSTTSGVYHKDSKIFVAFSSSTIFDPGKGFTPAMVFIELEDGDINAAKTKLIEILK